jgi:hypothetical protein
MNDSLIDYINNSRTEPAETTSYTLIKKAVEFYADVDVSQIDVDDLNMLYASTCHRGVRSQNALARIIERSHLSQEAKTVLLDIDRTAVQRGFFGTGLGKPKNLPNDAQIFIKALVAANGMSGREKIFATVDDALQQISGNAMAVFSQILLCYNPKLFPVLNSQNHYKEISEIGLPKAINLKNYIASAKLICDWRDEHCPDMDFRTLDLRIWAYSNKERDSKLQPEENLTNMEKPLSNESMNIIEKLIDREIEQGTQQLVLTGAPGTGKTYSVLKYVTHRVSANEAQSGFVQFHPSYDYADFIEGIRPFDNGSGEMVFKKADGIFKAFCRVAAKANETEKHYFVIDEINRADLSKVFGEIMFCLEESYRGEENRIQTQYHNLKSYDRNGEEIEDDVFSGGFYIPKNVILIGTMNDIDRSVESFDFALRRRFKWLNIHAETVMEETIKAIWSEEPFKQLNQLFERIAALNQEISENGGATMGLDENYHIGPAYFKPKKGELDLEEYIKWIWDTRLESLLREYVRGRSADKVTAFIAECKKKLLQTKPPVES